MSEEAVARVARSRRILTGIVGGLVGRAISLVAPFIVMPVMLRHLGHADFGIWMTAMSITSMSLFLDFGIGNGLLTKLSSAYGSSDIDEMRRLISSGYAALSSIALLLFAVFGALMIACFYGLLSSGFMGDSSSSSSIVISCVVIFLAGIPASVIQKVFYSCQLVWLGNVWQIAASVVSVLMCLAAIKLGWGAWQVVTAYTLPPVVFMVIAAVWFFMRRPELTPSFSKVSIVEVRVLTKLGSRFLVLAVITSIALNVDNIIIAKKLGASAVTDYAVPAKLASILGLMVTTLFMPLWPANGEAFARKDYDWIRKSTRKMSVFGGAAVAVAGLGLILLGDQIMLAWMGTLFDGQEKVLLFLAATFTLMAITSPFNMLINSTGRLREQIYAWLAFLIFTLAAKILLLEEGSVWLMALITAVGYMLLILPAMYSASSRVLSKGLESERFSN